MALADHRCALTIRTAGLSDSTTWGDLWEFAVDLASMCARGGMQGREIKLGRFEDFMVTSSWILMLLLGEGGHLAMFLTDPSNDNIDPS